MGKSPGKWIKTILFGKKSSKSNLSKKNVSEKEPTFATNAPPSDPPKGSDSAFHSIDKSGTKSEFSMLTDNLPDAGIVLLPGTQDINVKASMELGSLGDAEISQQQNAVTKVQAVYRGYLARRAFRALKGIIRLQAVVRGHLVRRQAISTLYCMRGIIKLQALIRGQSVNFCDARIKMKKRNNLPSALDAKLVDSVEVIGSHQLEELSANSFAVKLMASSTMSSPLHLQYESIESNSASRWLDRWSSSRFWESFIDPEKTFDLKPQRTEASNQFVEREQGRSRRTVRKAVTMNVAQSSENENPKFRMKKPSVIPSETVVDNPQNELERVKRGLRKVSAETVTEKSNHIPKKEREKTPEAEPSDIVTEKKPCEHLLPGDMPIGGGVHDDDLPVLEPYKQEDGKSERRVETNEELVSKEDESSKQNQKVRRRRSLPLKQEYLENAPQNNAPTMPSYMAATQSAKAKVRGQGFPRVMQDEPEIDFARRHSLSSATNGKVSSRSPRLQKLNHLGTKGGFKADKSLSTSRESHEKAEWRR